jgi:hypothetical protein
MKERNSPKSIPYGLSFLKRVLFIDANINLNFSCRDTAPVFAIFLTAAPLSIIGALASGGSHR